MEERITLEQLKTHYFDIEIPNFEKWNPDIGRPRHWIKIDTAIVLDPRIRNLTPLAFSMYIQLLCYRGRSRSQLVRLTLPTVPLSVTNRGRNKAQALLKLSELKLCRIAIKSLRIEENRIEEKRSSGTVRKPKQPEPEKRSETEPENDRQEDRQSLAPGNPPHRVKNKLPSASQFHLPLEVTPEWVRDLFPKSMLTQLLRIYESEEDWIETEFRKMTLWLSANRSRSPKSLPGWNRFVTGWLQRGWEKYRRHGKEPKKLVVDHAALWGEK